MYNNGRKPTHNLNIKQRHMICRARMERMTEFLVKGYTLSEISKEMKIPYRSIAKLKDRLDRQTKKRHQDNVDTLRDIKLRQYAWCQRELLEQWEASKKNSKGESKRPDVIFMDRVLAIWEAERKMLGIDIVNKDVDDKGGQLFDWKTLTSVNVNITNNGNAVHNANTIVKQQVEAAIARPAPTTERIVNDVEERIKELERRAALREERQEMERQIDDNHTRNKRLVLKGRVIPITVTTNSVECNETFSQESEHEDSALASMLGVE